MSTEYDDFATPNPAKNGGACRYCEKQESGLAWRGKETFEQENQTLRLRKTVLQAEKERLQSVGIRSFARAWKELKERMQEAF